MDRSERWRRGAAAWATLTLAAGLCWSTGAWLWSASGLLADGRWVAFWGGHLRLHLGTEEVRLPWTDLLAGLGVVQLGLIAAAVLAVVAVGRPGRRALAAAALVPLAWGLAWPIDPVGRRAEIDEPSSVELHVGCEHGRWVVSSSWFAGC